MEVPYEFGKSMYALNIYLMQWAMVPKDLTIDSHRFAIHLTLL